MENAEKFVISRVPRIERLLEILKLVDTCKGGGSSEKDGTRKSPIFSMEFGKIVYFLADFGRKNTGGHRNLLF